MSNGGIMDNKEDSNGNSERVELFCCPGLGSRIVFFSIAVLANILL